MKMSRLGSSFLVGLGLFLACAVALELSARKYFPSFGLIPPLGALILLVPCIGFAVVGLRSRIYFVLCLTVLVGSSLIVRGMLVRVACSYACSSCANHIIYIGSRFEQFMMSKPDDKLILPATTEFDDFLGMLQSHGYIGNFQYEYCAGRRLSKLKTGYEYIGGGLSMKTIGEKDPLIAFCAAECHPPPYDRDQHILSGNGSRCANREVMIQYLSRALAQAESGEVPYSPEAVAIIKMELQKRTQAR